MAVEFKTIKRSEARLNLTPLIDVIFQLLVFFMLTSSFIHPSINMELPRADLGGQTNKDRKIILSLTKDGQVFLNSDQSSIASLPEELRAELVKNNDKSVYLKSDKEVSYNSFFEIIEIATKAGAANFHLVHEAKNVTE
ncbi:MAG: biopolymer transporter ExbD [Bdellovibrionales bacterium]|nr:biopolymer transporter ExbD [Bdellovibrionales bacterium]